MMTLKQALELVDKTRQGVIHRQNYAAHRESIFEAYGVIKDAVPVTREHKATLEAQAHELFVFVGDCTR